MKSSLALLMCLVAVTFAESSNEEIELDKSLLRRALLDLRDVIKTPESRAIRCGPGMTPCDMKGNADCVSMAVRCDGVQDCESGQDEAFCDLICGKMYGKMSRQEWEAGYYCERDRKCIYQHQRCDGVTDCPKDKLEETDALGCGRKKPNLRDLINQYLADAEN